MDPLLVNMASKQDRFLHNFGFYEDLNEYFRYSPSPSDITDELFDDHRLQAFTEEELIRDAVARTDSYPIDDPTPQSRENAADQQVPNFGESCHTDQIIAPLEPAKSTVNGYERESCNLIQPQLTYHAQRSRKHRCDDCGKRFGTLELLHDHVQRHVTQDRPFECNHCSSQFYHESDLWTHISARHELAADYQCGTCGKRFVRRDQLLGHEAVHGRWKRYDHHQGGGNFARQFELC